MQISSIQRSKIQKVLWKEKTIETGIFKVQVKGSVSVTQAGLGEDEQAEKDVHGGEFKAVYSYAKEHYDYWRQIRQVQLPHGKFGENLTTEGLEESQVAIGDQFRMGSVVLEAIQPRLPCYKLGIAFEDPAVITQFWESNRFGIYFRVETAGEICAGDKIEVLKTYPERAKISDLFQLRKDKHPSKERLEFFLSLSYLEPSWRKWCEKKHASAKEA